MYHLKGQQTEEPIQKPWKSEEEQGRLALHSHQKRERFNQLETAYSSKITNLCHIIDQAKMEFRQGEWSTWADWWLKKSVGALSQNQSSRWDNIWGDSRSRLLRVCSPTERWKTVSSALWELCTQNVSSSRLLTSAVLWLLWMWIGEFWFKSLFSVFGW